MADKDNADQEPEATKEAASSYVPKGRRSFAKMRRELSEEELSTPAVQKLLIDETERLETENRTLAEFRDNYHRADKRVAILEEERKKSVAQEIIFGVCLAVGAAALGYAPSVWSEQPTGWIFLVFGFILIICGIASKVVKR